MQQRGGPRTDAEMEQQRKRRVLMEIDRLEDIKRFCANGGENNYVLVLEYIDNRTLNDIAEKSLFECFLKCGKRVRWPKTIYKIAIMTHKYLIELRKFVRKKDKHLLRVLEDDYPDGYDSDDLRTVENNFMDRSKSIFETLLEVLQNITRYDTHEIIDEVLTTWIHILDHLGHSKVGIAKFVEIEGIDALF